MHEPPNDKDALEIDCVGPQSPLKVSSILMDWIYSEHFTYREAAEVIGIPCTRLIAITNGARAHHNECVLLAEYMPRIYV